jgi:excisionase family DNA binding protein
VSDYAPLAYTIAEAVKATGLTRTRLYTLASQGKLQFRRAGRRTVILARDLQQFLEDLPPAPIRAKKQNSCLKH